MRRPRKNEKPEFEFKKVMVKWLSDNGWECDVVESKAVYNFAAGRYDHGQAEAGFSDIVGVVPWAGVGAFIELKAPGKRSTLKPHQRDFLLRKIKKGAFGVCVDSIEILSDTYKCWLALRKEGMNRESIVFLIECLPKIKEVDDTLTFD